VASSAASVGFVSEVMCFFSPFIRKSAVRREDQDGQLDPSRVSIAADPEGGKLNEGAINSAKYRYIATDLVWLWSGQTVIEDID
jgi:hypothetical protein